MKLLLLAVLLLPACPPAPVPPAPPLADAAPYVPTPDASPPGTPCQAACDALSRLCGAQLGDCVRTLAHIESARLIRENSGQPLTCADVASASSVATMRTLGLACQ
jgi:hypothetical protein